MAHRICAAIGSSAYVPCRRWPGLPRAQKRHYRHVRSESAETGYIVGVLAEVPGIAGQQLGGVLERVRDTVEVARAWVAASRSSRRTPPPQAVTQHTCTSDVVCQRQLFRRYAPIPATSRNGAA
jgi:hypothetical protein